MLVNLYSVKDLKSNSVNMYQVPVYAGNDAQAMRDLEHAFMTGGSILSSHPEDFELYKVGSFDMETGRLNAIDPEFLFNAKSLKPTSPVKKERK